MTAVEPADTIDRDGLDLLTAIVSANVSQAAHTTNTLLDLKDAEIRDLRQTLSRLGKVLEDATVVDRRTEDALRPFWSEFHAAREALMRTEAAS